MRPSSASVGSGRRSLRPEETMRWREMSTGAYSYRPSYRDRRGAGQGRLHREAVGHPSQPRPLAGEGSIVADPRRQESIAKWRTPTIHIEKAENLQRE